MHLESPQRVAGTVDRLVSNVAVSCGQENPETVSLECALGRTLARDVTADRGQPPFHRATMDGIATPTGAIEAGLRTFRSTGIHPAGGDPRLWTNPEKDTCIEIMTGAAVPDGYDTVVRYEDLEGVAGPGPSDEYRHTETSGEHTFVIVNDRYTGGENIHRKGDDYQLGELLIPRGERINSTHLAVLASCGWSSVPVLSRPSIAILGTGDELVPVDKSPRDYQIRASNPWTITGELISWGFPPAVTKIVGDGRTVMEQEIAALLDAHDIVLLSGAVSKGLYDTIPAILQDLDVDILIHGVRQRPGKPLLVGRRERYGRETVVMGLPGNPVSSLVSVRRYLVPALATSFGFDHGPTTLFASGISARLTTDVDFKPPLTWFPAVRAAWNLPAHYSTDDHVDIEVSVLPGNGSGDFFHLTASTGIIEVTEECRKLPAGSIVRFFPWGA